MFTGTLRIITCPNLHLVTEDVSKAAWAGVYHPPSSIPRFCNDKILAKKKKWQLFTQDHHRLSLERLTTLFLQEIKEKRSRCLSETECQWWSIQTDFERDWTGNGNLINTNGFFDICYPFTLQWELELDRNRELREWVSNPCCNLHGYLTGQPMVSCTVNFFVHRFQFHCSVKGSA